MGKIKYIIRDYCSWEPLEIPNLPCRHGDSVFVKGDLNGKLTWDSEQEYFFGIFEFPAKDHEQGYYEVLIDSNGRETVLQRVNVKYVFNDEYFPPRWENVNAVNKFLVRHYSHFLEREIISRIRNSNGIFNYLKLPIRQFH